MNSIRIRRHELTLLPESARVIIRPFIPAENHRVASIIGRVLALSEKEVGAQLGRVRGEFDGRHLDIESSLLAHFEKARKHVISQRTLSRERQLLIGAMFSGEYALESAAIFNPSIVPHPDQSEAPDGGLRFIMSLRATGEGHISSIEFRAGTIAQDGRIALDPVSRFVTAPEVIPDPSYEKRRFQIKLREMAVDNQHVDEVLALLGERFTRSDLKQSLGAVRLEPRAAPYELHHDSNYELRFSNQLAISERIIFPVSQNETNGIEDARFVRFVDNDG
jgi:hypothetical protein